MGSAAGAILRRREGERRAPLAHSSIYLSLYLALSLSLCLSVYLSINLSIVLSTAGRSRRAIRGQPF